MRAQIILSFLFFNFSLLGPFQTQGSPLLVDGIDVSPLIEDFKLQLRTLTRPITVYNWSPNGHLSEDQLAISAQNWSESFWKHYGNSQNDTDAYGFGWYAAADPVVSQSFGGAGNNWLLAQIRLPVGFRFINLADDKFPSIDSKLSAASRFLLEKFQCPKTKLTHSLLAAGGQLLKPSCQNLVRKTLKEFLRIQGFAYFYSHTEFEACEAGKRQDIAFVITEKDWIKPDSIEFYNARTQNKQENRIRIQTLFLQAAHGDKGPPLIKADEAKTTKMQKLLWADLEGVPKSKDNAEWLKQNKFGCDGTIPLAE